MREAEIIELPRPVHRPAGDGWARDIADPVDAAGKPFLVAEDQIDQHVEGEGDEGEVMVLYAQGGIAEQPADRKTRHGAEQIGGPERPAPRGQIGGDVGADPDEGRLRQRDLAGITERQVETDGGNGHHRPHAENEDAVGLESERRHQKKHSDEREHDRREPPPAPPHIVRSSIRPSSPCGRNRMTRFRISSAIAIRYCEERYAAAKLSITPSSRPPTIAPRTWLKPPTIAAMKA